MDPISTAITAAWLEAVRRVQSLAHRRLVEIDPGARSHGDSRTLTDAIEAALVSAGAGPQAVSAPKSAADAHALDLRV